MKTREPIITDTPVRVLSVEEAQQRAAERSMRLYAVVAEPDQVWTHPSGGFYLDRLLSFERRRLRVSR